MVSSAAVDDAGSVRLATSAVVEVGRFEFASVGTAGDADDAAAAGIPFWIVEGGASISVGEASPATSCVSVAAVTDAELGWAETTFVVTATRTTTASSSSSPTATPSVSRAAASDSTTSLAACVKI